MAERVDLDAVEVRYHAGSDADSRADVPALVAECKAGRRVVEACRPVLAHHGGRIRDNGLPDDHPDYRYWVEPPPRVLAARDALDAYDQAAGNDAGVWFAHTHEHRDEPDAELHHHRHDHRRRSNRGDHDHYPIGMAGDGQEGG